MTPANPADSPKSISPNAQAIPPTQADPSPLAQALVEALPRLCGGDSPVSSATATTLAELIGALAAALEQGELELALDGPAPEGIDPQGWPGRHRQALAASPLAVLASELERLPEAPLVWSGARLRWRRWHLQLEDCLGQLTARALAPLAPAPDKTAVDQAVASAAGQGLDPQQQQAVAALLRHGLVLLGGGPGTGKTSTVVQMLGARLALRPELRLHLAAPTGKAAARLRSTLQEGSQRLAGPLAERLGQAPCTTLHRLLESSGERFGRNRRHPLALDLLVVDELSMVDLPLMAALLEALPDSCQLLLVGDPAQLPPVGPGAVLQELGQPNRLAALGEAAIELKTTYRNNGAIAAFAALLRPGDRAALLRPRERAALLRPGEQEPGVGAATHTSPGSASAGPKAGVGQTEALIAQLGSLGPEDNLIWQRHPAGRLPAPALERLRRHQQRLQALAEAIDWGTGAAGTSGEGESLATPPSPGAPSPSPALSDPPSAAKPLRGPGPEAIAALLAELEACVLLSPVRQGAWGVEAVQRQLLGEAAGKAIQHWPLGTPVLCQRNLADEGLANGDIGVLVERAGERLVLFPGPFPGPAGANPGSSSPQARLFHPARLGSAEPALALTIHKSQGSQYQDVVLLVPQTRHWDPRLLYTGLTRARQRAWLITTTAPSWLLAD
jgi:exodeoxyribonuclease V alpha subunit